ncbi:MAG: DUF4469 domain-containing protein [Tannerella sp.]|jgi:hypothetical protein|nr:DUF4469 domain-containing protein [Tannerella sp.]
MKKGSKVIVELYDLLITNRRDDRSGRVVHMGSLKIEDIIALAIKQGTDLNAATLKASYDILKEVALGEFCNGKQVEFGLAHCGLGVKGVFLGDHATWNPDEDSLVMQSSATLETRNALKDVAVEVRGMAQSGIFINTLTDVVSGEVNARITPGGAVNLTGFKIKIVGDGKHNTGIFLDDINSGNDPMKVPDSAIATNDPSKITFVVPSDLPAGDYRLSITTQFASGATPLKEPRTYVFDYVLACG